MVRKRGPFLPLFFSVIHPSAVSYGLHLSAKTILQQNTAHDLACFSRCSLIDKLVPTKPLVPIFFTKFLFFVDSGVAQDLVRGRVLWNKHLRFNRPPFLCLFLQIFCVLAVFPLCLQLIFWGIVWFFFFFLEREKEVWSFYTNLKTTRISQTGKRLSLARALIGPGITELWGCRRNIHSFFFFFLQFHSSVKPSWMKTPAGFQIEACHFVRC